MSNFNDIQDKRLQAYNRCVMFYNCLEDAGRVPAQEYLSQFSMKDRLLMIDLIKEVKEKGLEPVKAKIIREMTPEGYDEMAA